MSLLDLEDTFEELFDMTIELCKNTLMEEIHQEKIRRKRIWIRKWIARRSKLEASNTLLKELSQEDPLLLEAVSPFIQKRNTHLRMALPSQVKLEITLRFLATEHSLHSLALFF